MFRPRRSGRGSRFVYWQVGLFFLAAGIWVGAVAAGRPGLTGIAIGVLVFAMVLGMIGRRPEED